MDSIFNLEKMFPTDESRFDAYKKFVIFGAIFSPFMRIVNAIYAHLIRAMSGMVVIPDNYITLYNVLNVLSLIGVFVGLFSLYVSLYIFWKGKILHALLKKALFILVGFIFSYIIYTILFYLLIPRSMEFLGAFLGPIVASFLMILVIIITLVIKWSYIRQYTEKYRNFVNDSVKLLFVPIVCFLLIMSGVVATLLTTTARQFNGTPFGIAVILAVLIWFIAPPIIVVNMLNREKALKNTFYNAMLQFNMSTLFILCLLFTSLKIAEDVVTGYDWHIDDMSDIIDSSSMDTGDPVPGAYDFHTIHLADGSDTDTGMDYMHPDTIGHMHNTDMHYTETDADRFEHFPDSHTDLHEPDLNAHTDSPFTYSGSDMMGGHFTDVFGGTNIVDIPQIQQHPYMIFNDPSVHGNFQICDSDGMPQMTISNGNIVNSEYAVIGHVNTNAAGVTTFTDMNNLPMYSVDSHGQMFSGDCYIGSTKTSGDVTIISDMHDRPMARYDNLTKTWFDFKTSKPISKIKPM